MSVSLLRKSFQIKNLNNFFKKFNFSISTVKCLATDESAAKKTTEVPKLEKLKEINPFFNKYEAKLKKVYE
jgi:hypothetical protein